MFMATAQTELSESGASLKIIFGSVSYMYAKFDNFSIRKCQQLEIVLPKILLDPPLNYFIRNIIEHFRLNQ